MRLETNRPALRRFEHCFEDGGGRASEGVGGGESCLVGYGGDEFSCSFFIQPPGVEANGDDGRRLDEGCDLLVQAGHAGWGRAGDVLEDLLVRVAGAQDQAIWARAVHEAKRHPRVRRMSQGALALDQDEVGRGPGRLEHQLFGGTRDEIRDHGVDADAPPRDDYAGLSRGDELGGEAGLPGGPLDLQGRRHLADGAVRPYGERDLGPDLEALPREERDALRRLAHVPDGLAGKLGREPLVEAADDLDPSFRRNPQGLHPLFRKPPACGGEPDQNSGRRELQRLFERPDYWRITPEVWQDAGHALPRERRVHDTDDLVLAVADQAVRRLGGAVGEQALGQDGVAPLRGRATNHRASTPRPGSSGSNMRPLS